MEAVALQLCLHFVVIYLHTSAYLRQFNTSGHCCALLCALTDSLAGLAEMRDVQRGASASMSAPASCQFQATSANKLFISWHTVCSVAVFFHTCFHWKVKRSSFWGNYGKKEAGESAFCLPPSVFFTYSLSHHTCKWAVITSRLPTCWLSPHLSLCLFIHNSSHLILFFISGSLKNLKCVLYKISIRSCPNFTRI